MAISLTRKIVTPDALAATLREVRAAGRTVVQCHGCFDLVHPGHIRYLESARELGDVLVVSLTGDGDISKGVGRPYIPQELRAENLAALEFVDFVVIDPHPTAAELLELLRPDVYVKGGEYATSQDPRFLREREIVERHGGRIVFHSGEVVFSSSRLIAQMSRDLPLEAFRLRALCKRSGIDEAAVRATLAAFGTLRVVVVGDLVNERYVLCDTAGAIEDAPALALRQLAERTTLGGAAAAAQQAAALGAAVTLIGATPRGGDARCADMPGAIRCVPVPVRSEPVTRSTFLADDAKVFQLTHGSAQPLDSRAEQCVAGELAAALAEADVLLWCDHGFGAVTPGLVARVARESANRPQLVTAGHGIGRDARLTALVDTHLLTATERQLREAMHDMGSSLPAVAATLLNRVRGQELVIAVRKRGMLGFERGADATTNHDEARLRGTFFPSLAAHALDPLGGDEAVLVIAAMVRALGRPLPLATYLAAAGEALAVARPGFAPVSAQDLHAWLQTRPELLPESRFIPNHVARAPDGPAAADVLPS